MTYHSYQNDGNRIGPHILFSLAFLLLLLLATITYSDQGIFAKALAQSDDSTTPTLTINAYFAHWSYGLAGISGQVQNPYPDYNSLHLEVYNPDNELVLDEQINLNIYEDSDNQTSASFGNIYFNIERQYVYNSYTIIATLANQSITEVMPPFSSEFEQPPEISIESLQEGDDGSVGISGHVWGGIAKEQLDFSIYSPDGMLLTTVTTELGLHAQFSTTVNANDASLIFTENGDYTILGNLVETNAPQVEATLTYLMQDYATRSFLEVAAVDTNSEELEIMFSVYQNGELIGGGVSPESMLLYDGQAYHIDLFGLNEYMFDHWEDIGSTSEDRMISISADEQIVAVYRNVNESLPEPEQPTQDDEDSPDDEEESDPENVPAGTLISPFLFNNNTTTAPETAGSEQLLEDVDVLHINGTLASFHFAKDMRLYILSGNWSMAMNGTAVIDFGANFTTVRANGLDRQTYSLDNLTAVNDSDLILGNDTLALSSLFDYHANGTITKVNATVTLEKLNVIKIETTSLDTPIYGMVDKVVRNINGETQVMARQFDMI
jgi:hypothetical protein